MEAQPARSERMLKSIREFAPEDFFKGSNRQQEFRMGWDPATAVGTQTASRNDAMDVRMMFQLLTPGMQHTEEPDVSAEVFGVPGDLNECRSAGLNKKIVNDLLVLQCNRAEFVRQRKDDMRIGCRK